MEPRGLVVNAFQTRGVNRLSISITAQDKYSALAQLRAKLGFKAKLESKFKFYTLYSHVCRWDVLHAAWDLVKSNGGAAGYDMITFSDIERSEGGVEGFLEKIRGSLIKRTYRADPVKRVYIPKSDGKQRPLGIPTIKDRIVQAALVLIIEPIFEQDFENCSYGFRPERSAHQAIDEIKEAVYQGKHQIYDADLQSYFDTIPHDKLLKAVKMRIVDQRVLKLIEMWLTAPIWEEGKPMKPTDVGSPQGGVISPLLSNIYLHWFDKAFQTKDGPGVWAKAQLIRYADDFVILARYLTPKIQMWIEQQIEGRFGLKINREKTKIVNLTQPKQSISFLGFTFRWVNSRKGKQYCQIQPSERALTRARVKIRQLTHPRNGHLPLEVVIKRVNLFLLGWGKYFNKGMPSSAFGKLNLYVHERMVHFLRRRSQRGYRTRKDDETWYRILDGLGLIKLTRKRFQ
jgi:RNA-directed DNA polymerase